MHEQSIIVKLGGSMTQSQDTLGAIATEIRAICCSAGGFRPVAVVHGGGGDVSAISRRLGIEPTFEDGIRMTGDAEMDVVDMVLCGLVNKRIVRAFGTAGLRAAGVSGADGTMLRGARVRGADGEPSRTAQVKQVDIGLVHCLWNAGFVPVIASPGADERGTAVNINADEAAFSVGVELGSDTIVFFSDVPGILVDNTAVSELTMAEAERLIASGVITGGMVAKVRSIGRAITGGVRRVVVASYDQSGDLGSVLRGERGTTVYAE